MVKQPHLFQVARPIPLCVLKLGREGAFLVDCGRLFLMRDAQYEK